MCLLLAAACSSGTQEVASRNQAEPAAANAAEVQPKPATGRCTPLLTPELDRESIVAALGGRKAGAGALDALKDKAGQAFDRAAQSLCRAGKIDPKLLGPFRTLIIQNGSGATEATFYEDPHEFSSEDLIFQWTFAESGLDVPPQDDIEAGLLCWARPNRPECAEREP